ncbi:hypothetical protein FV139_14900 [Parahaliea maris]|uniref:Uncharacterized protein n=1 Tax=Parahaliea maris TaxID=2716870 RepID=A0A5C8ZXR1_9GAMM|nr:hypothetical protein [Parahaliea maris]TXS92011.1 hypothetical protein FV139_14900 [Parahaliea maris]
MRSILFAVLTLVPLWGYPAPENRLGDFEYWQQSEGWWLGNNSYMDGQMNYRVKQYHTITGIAVEDGKVVETEYKFFPPGEGSAFASGGKVGADRGIEIITISEHARADSAGTVRQVSIRPDLAGSNGMETRLVAPDSAIRRVLDPVSGYEHYRQFISLNPRDKRYVINMGLVSESADEHADIGSLRGFAVSRAERIAADRVESERARLRVLHAVGGTVSSAPDGTRTVEVYEDPEG